MAKMYRETVANFNKSLLTSLGTGIFTISPIDADQVPSGYVKTCKVSVNPQDGSSRNFMVVASTSPTPLSSSDIITGGTTGEGGGTVWLNLKRPIKSSAAETDRSDGEVYIHVYTQAPIDPLNPIEIDFLGEVWGRFINLQAV